MHGSFRGLAQINLPVEDVGAARDWYTEALGVASYFQRPDPENPAYVEFRIGDRQDELGLINASFLPPGGATRGGVIARWHVNDLPAAVERLKTLGATEYEPIIEREAGFVTASVVDPFGNVLGLIYSPHFIDQIDAASRAES